MQVDLPRPRKSQLASRSPEYGADWNAQGRQGGTLALPLVSTRQKLVNPGRAVPARTCDPGQSAEPEASVT